MERLASLVNYILKSMYIVGVLECLRLRKSYTNLYYILIFESSDKANGLAYGLLVDNKACVCSVVIYSYL